MDQLDIAGIDPRRIEQVVTHRLVEIPTLPKVLALPIFGAVARPENYAVANAIGASIAQVGGEIDKVVSIDPAGRDETIAALKQEAVEKAVAAGARPDSVAIIDFDEVPIPYLPGNATRVRAKAVGDLEMGAR